MMVWAINCNDFNVQMHGYLYDLLHCTCGKNVTWNKEE